VLDARVDTDIERIAADDGRMMRLIDARVPHFGGDECFFSHRPLIAVQTKISARAQGLFLAVVIRLRLPLHAGFMVPIGKDARFPVGVDWEIGVQPVALAFGVLILADDLFIQIPEQS